MNTVIASCGLWPAPPDILDNQGFWGHTDSWTPVAIPWGKVEVPGLRLQDPHSQDLLSLPLMHSFQGLTYVSDPTEPGSPILGPLLLFPLVREALCLWGLSDVSLPGTGILPGIRLKSLQKPFEPIYIVKNNSRGTFNTEITWITPFSNKSAGKF